MSKLPVLKLKPGKEVPVMAGHPWIFSNAIIEGPLSDEGRKFEEVGLVEVRAHDGYFLGIGMYNSRTSISVRMLSLSKNGRLEKNFIVDEKFFSERFLALEKLKKEFLPARTTAYRLVNADADYLPGLIVDRYGCEPGGGCGVFVFQIHTAGMDLFREKIVEALRESFDCEAIVERSDIESRRADGLQSLPVKIHHGKIDGKVKFLENGVKFLADVLNGQKTGFFLDQREARRKAGELSKGKKVLNLFAYTGGFGLYAALNGAEKVVTLDVSEKALELAQENFRMNEIDIDSKNGMEKYEFIRGDAFDYLEEIADASNNGGIFDLIICDPPAFAKSNDKIEQAKKAYIDLNKKCLELLGDGGILVTCSCSGRISQEDFRDVLRISAGRIKRDVRILASLSQPFDHTERLCFSEGRYLKTFILQALN